MSANIKAKTASQAGAPKRRDSIPMADFTQPLVDARRINQEKAVAKKRKEENGEEVVEGEEVRSSGVLYFINSNNPLLFDFGNLLLLVTFHFVFIYILIYIRRF